MARPSAKMRSRNLTSSRSPFLSAAIFICFTLAMPTEGFFLGKIYKHIYGEEETTTPAPIVIQYPQAGEYQVPHIDPSYHSSGPSYLEYPVNYDPHGGYPLVSKASSVLGLALGKIFNSWLSLLPKIAYQGDQSYDSEQYGPYEPYPPPPPPPSFSRYPSNRPPHSGYADAPPIYSHPPKTKSKSPPSGPSPPWLSQDGNPEANTFPGGGDNGDYQDYQDGGGPPPSSRKGHHSPPEDDYQDYEGDDQDQTKKPQGKFQTDKRHYHNHKMEDDDVDDQYGDYESLKDSDNNNDNHKNPYYKSHDAPQSVTERKKKE